MNPMELARQAAHPYQPPIAGKWQEQWLERYTALVASKTVELTGQDLCDLEVETKWDGDSHDFEAIVRAVLAKCREKSK